jgi:hypothetical protein
MGERQMAQSWLEETLVVLAATRVRRRLCASTLWGYD